ncbi:MAG: hypothetical protein H7X80_03595, partial [bacterium]|nr:hypothetical protein [Candidatus Kapabacteria bacterium]
DALFRIADKDKRSALIDKRLSDSSLLVVASAISMMASTDTTGLMAVLMKWKGVEGRSGQMAQAWVSAVASARLESLIDDVTVYTRPPHGRTSRWQAFVALSSIERTTPAVRAAIVDGLRDRTSIVRNAAAEAARVHLDSDLRQALVALREGEDPERQKAIDDILKAN